MPLYCNGSGIAMVIKTAPLQSDAGLQLLPITAQILPASIVLDYRAVTQGQCRHQHTQNQEGLGTSLILHIVFQGIP